MIVKLTPVNEGKSLTRHDLVEILQTWLELYECVAKSTSTGRAMKAGLIKVVSSMYVTEEVAKTPASFRIIKAIELAKQGKSLLEIRDYIAEAVLILTK